MSRSRICLAAPVVGASLLEYTGDTLGTILQHAQTGAFGAGVQHGREQELAQAAGRLDAITLRIEEAHGAATDALAKTAVLLARKIAETLLQRELRAHNYDIERLVRNTLAESAVGRSACSVHLNPVDFERLSGVPFRSGTQLQADEGVAAGDVHVETALGLLVREAMGSLDAISEAMLEEVE